MKVGEAWELSGTEQEGAVQGQDGDEAQADRREEGKCWPSAGKAVRESMGLGLRQDQGESEWTGAGQGRDQDGHGAERARWLVEPFIPPDSYRAVLCPQPQPHKAYS